MRNVNLLSIATIPATLYVIRNHCGFSLAHRFLWQRRLMSACAVAEREGPYTSTIAPIYMVLRTQSTASIVPRNWNIMPHRPEGARYVSHLLYTFILMLHLYNLLTKLLVVTLALL